MIAGCKMLDAIRDFPLTQSQLRFWHGTKLAPAEPIYTMVWRFDLLQQIDPERFASALESVVRDTDALHLAFREIGGEPRQFANPHHFALSAVLDLSGDADAEAALQSWQTEWMRNPFDLNQSTYRAQLVKLAPEHWVWLSAQHHIACDAQSGALLFAAVSKVYEKGQLAENPSYLAAAERIDADYSAGPNADERQKKDDQPKCGKPYGVDTSGSALSTRVVVPISTDTVAKFEARVSDPAFAIFTPDLTRFALYAAAYAAFLNRVSGSKHIRLGLPAHNRLDGASRTTQGLFVEVLPFKVKVKPEDSFADVYATVKANLGDFLRKAKPNAIAASKSSEVTGVLNFIKARFGEFASGPAKVTWLHSGAHDPQHPLRLHVIDFDGFHPEFALDISASVGAQVDTDQVGLHFAAVMEGCASNPQLAVADIPLCKDPNVSAARLVGPVEPTVAHGDVVSMIEAQVQATPSATALQQNGSTLSYAEMWEKAGHVATSIVSSGLGPGPIAMHMSRSIDAVIAILGILRAGRCFVPIAKNTPPARALEILTMSEAVAVFCDDDVGPEVADTGLRCLSTNVPPVPAPNVALADTAYIIFTSGSTGKPKGVVVSQSGLQRYIAWAARAFGGQGPVDYALFSSFSFDLTITTIFAPLICGGTMHIYKETGAQDMSVLDVFRDDAAEVVKLTPSHLALVCEASQPVRRIRNLVLGGENLSVPLCKQARSKLGQHIEVVNEYGPTEAVVGAMIHRFDPATDHESSVPIGVPADGVEITIRDTAMNVVPNGIEGEICISGRLADGYLNQPDLTNDRFKTTPDGERIYLTGDIGKLHKDGVFEYYGRADSQLKIGGVRLEAAEFDNALRSVPGVHAVHVQQGMPPRTGQCCTRCGLADTYPGATFDSAGVCSICNEFETYKDRARAYFRPEPELTAKVQEAQAKARGAYDAVMLLSGGKDSTYAAYRLAAITDRVLAVTLDNGFISDGAKENIARVIDDLDWDHRYLSTSKMNEIFVDSLKRYSNVCQGCFKAVYTLAIRVARNESVPMIVTGLSRGQFFETRLTPELFTKGVPTCAELEHMVTEARRRYHSEDDAVAQLLETSDLADGQFLEEIEIVDIYRYIDVPVSEIYAFLDARGAWQRPSDTGRSTNCTINDAGIHVHKAQEGFHNYALPYSWDVRMGHKTRDQALYELNDEIDQDYVGGILDQIGYGEPRALKDDDLTLYVVADKAVTQDDLYAALRKHLPSEIQPSQIMRIDEMPLTPNGKVDPARLPRPGKAVEFAAPTSPPITKTELRLATILQEVLPGTTVGRDTDFFDIGLDSLAAIQVAMRAAEIELSLPATALFDHRNLRALAEFADGLETKETETEPETEFDLGLSLDDDDFAAIANALS